MTTKLRRIMVVEDHRDAREVLVELIRLNGHRVESCPDAATALARLGHDDFDVLLTDVVLPDGDAWKLLTDLSERRKLPLRVISMSAYAATPLRGASVAFGCIGHLSKPFKMVELEQLLN